MDARSVSFHVNRVVVVHFPWRSRNVTRMNIDSYVPTSNGIINRISFNVAFRYLGSHVRGEAARIELCRVILEMPNVFRIKI